VQGGRWAGTACIAVLLALALGACGDEAAGDRPEEGPSSLTVYSSLPLHGRDRDRSRDMVDAIKLALQEGHGKIGNLRVTYVSLDSSTAQDGTWTRDRVLENARQAVRDPNAIAYIGDLSSAATALALPLVNEGHILQVSPTSTYDGLTRPGGPHKGEPDRFYPSGRRTFGRVVAPDHVQASALVGYMKQLGVRRLAIANDHGLYGSGITDQLQQPARMRGLQIVRTDRIDARKLDLSGAAQHIAAARPDGFLFAGDSDAEAARIFSAVAAADSDTLLFAPSGVAGRALAPALSASARRRIRITTAALPAPQLPPSAAVFDAQFRQTVGRQPLPDALAAYDATKLVLRSIHDAGKRGNDRDAVVKAFFAIGDRRSVLGTYSIDRYGDPSLSAFAGYRLRGRRPRLDRLLKVRG